SRVMVGIWGRLLRLGFCVAVGGLAMAGERWELVDRPISPEGEPAWEPQWSPDGRHLSVGLGRDGDMRAALIDVGTGESRALTPPRELLHATSWSPDGRRLVYATGERQTAGFVGRLECVVIGSGE